MSNHVGGGMPRSFHVRTRTQLSMPITDHDEAASSDGCAEVPRRSLVVEITSMKCLSSLLVVVLGIVGCGDGSAGPSANEALDPFGMWAVTGNATYGQFWITSQWGARANVASYRSGGQVYATTFHDINNFVSGGALVASNFPIPQRAPGEYQDLRGDFTNGNGPTFGAVTTWSLAGNAAAGIPQFSDNMYVPAEIRLTAPGVSVPSISRSTPLTITWNADANSGGVLILVDYRVDESLMRDPNLPTAKYRWKTITDDDGSYTVAASDLAGLPAGGIVQITLARGASKTSGTQSHPFHIYAYSTADIFHSVTQ